jgi:putative phosphoesterase
MLVRRQERVTLRSGKVGLISDTHGLVRPQALAALEGSELIIHAGDIGKPEVLVALASIAPVIAIKGNNDRDPWASELPDILTVQVNGVEVRVIHNVNELAKGAIKGELRAVICGHSHKPGVITREGVLFVNPGSAGPRRFSLPVSVARLKIQEEDVQAKILELKL